MWEGLGGAQVLSVAGIAPPRSCDGLIDDAQVILGLLAHIG